MARRLEYSIDLCAVGGLPTVVRSGRIDLREIVSEDSEMLGELMLESYRGTSDYEGETLEDAVEEIRAYLGGDRGGEALLTESRVALAGPVAVAACLVSHWGARQTPLITYVMTRSDWKRRGVGRLVLTEALRALRGSGWSEARAVITEGNEPSERLFLRLGFKETGAGEGTPPN